MACIRILYIAISVVYRNDTACDQIDFVKQVPVAIIFCIQHADTALQNRNIREIFLRHILCTEDQTQITDTISKKIVVKQLGITNLTLFIHKIGCLFFQVFTGKQRNLFQIFLGIFCFSEGIQLAYCLAHILNILFTHARFYGRQLFTQCFLLLFGKTFHRLQYYNTSMRIVQHVLLNQTFIIATLNLGAQSRKRIICLNVNKRLVLIIKPAVQHLQTIHQSLRVGTEICFPIFKLEIIDTCKKRLFLKALLHHVNKHFTDRLQEFFFLIGANILGDHTEIRLFDATIVDTVHILAQSLVNQSLFQRRAGRGAKCIINDLERHIKFRIQTVSRSHIQG